MDLVSSYHSSNFYSISTATILSKLSSLVWVVAGATLVNLCIRFDPIQFILHTRGGALSLRNTWFLCFKLSTGFSLLLWQRPTPLKWLLRPSQFIAHLLIQLHPLLLSFSLPVIQPLRCSFICQTHLIPFCLVTSSMLFCSPECSSPTNSQSPFRFQLRSHLFREFSEHLLPPPD